MIAYVFAIGHDGSHIYESPHPKISKPTKASRTARSAAYDKIKQIFRFKRLRKRSAVTLPAKGEESFALIEDTREPRGRAVADVTDHCSTVQTGGKTYKLEARANEDRVVVGVLRKGHVYREIMENLFADIFGMLEEEQADIFGAEHIAKDIDEVVAQANFENQCRKLGKTRSGRQSKQKVDVVAKKRVGRPVLAAEEEDEESVFSEENGRFGIASCYRLTFERKEVSPLMISWVVDALCGRAKPCRCRC